MGKLDDVLESCRAQLKDSGVKAIDETCLRAVAKGLGPNLYKRDARTVATSQPKEIENIKKNFLIKKLGCKDTPALDRAIDRVTDKIGRKNRTKLRPVFYYLLVKDLRKTGAVV